MTDQEYTTLAITDPKAIVRHTCDLMGSTRDDSYNDCTTRNADLSSLAFVVDFVSETVSNPMTRATVLKEAIVCAYLLGRKDEAGRDIQTLFND